MRLILCYHKVGYPVNTKKDRRLNVSVDGFEKQVRWFKRNGWNSVTFEAFCRDFDSLPQKTVCFTFDDAYSITVESAVPILSDNAFTGTFFVVSNQVGQPTGWDGADETKLASWEQLKECGKSGFSIENHTANHPRLADLSPDEVKSEVQLGEQMILDMIGRCPKTLCYPYGSHNDETVGVLNELSYIGACTVEPYRITEKTDKQRLPRTIIAYRDGLLGMFYRAFIRPHLK